MRFLSDTSIDGIRQRLFLVGDLPGALWTPADSRSTLPLILLSHGGGEHKQALAVVDRAHRLARGRFAVATVDVPGHGDRPAVDEYHRIATANQARADAGEPLAPLIAGFQAMVARQTVPEWQSVLDALYDRGGFGAAGYWGVSLGCGLGVPFVAAEPRIGAAVLGLGGGPAAAAAAADITVPVQFLLQWDDERVPRDQGLALFEAFASAEKTLHANPGRHGELPAFELESSMRFFARHLR
jgi:dienelactone hydrolase